MSEEAKRISNLFLGCELGYGTYRQEEKTAGKVKSEIKRTAQTVRGPTTLDLWEKHLSGERSLGIIPIREDGTCYWGVIDVDKYDLSHRSVADKIKKLGLPLLLCKSKSGGAHLFVFLHEPVAAADMMSKLREFAAMMGYGDSEIFPKQTQLLREKGDLGNWLNMPYFKADGGNRYAVDDQGRGLSIKKFLDLAEANRLSAKQFLKMRPKAPEAALDFADGPPCLQHLSSIGVDEGGRNNALFAFGVMAKKMKPDNWEPLLEGWNQKFVKPPLTSDEVQIVIKSLRKKDYTYKCKEPPIMNHCDQQLCRTRRFGVGVGAMPTINSISVLDSVPATYFVVLENGTTVECTADDLLSAKTFQRTVLLQAGELIPLYKQDNFYNKIHELLDQAVHIEAPLEVTIPGIFRHHLEEFLTDQYAAKTLEEVLLGKPFHDEERGLYWFRPQDFMAYLEKVKFKEYTSTQVYTRVKELGGERKYFSIKKKNFNAWFIPANLFERQSESFTVPRVKDAPV